MFEIPLRLFDAFALCNFVHGLRCTARFGGVFMSTVRCHSLSFVSHTVGTDKSNRMYFGNVLAAYFAEKFIRAEHCNHGDGGLLVVHDDHKSIATVCRNIVRNSSDRKFSDDNKIEIEME